MRIGSRYRNNLHDYCADRVLQVYIAEVVSADMRGRLGAVNQLSITIGVLIAYSLGTVLSYKWLAIVGIGLSAVHAVGMWFLPETPRWLLGRDRRDEVSCLIVDCSGVALWHGQLPCAKIFVLLFVPSEL